jgi:phage major head subunit gpT-like protein
MSPDVFTAMLRSEFLQAKLKAEQLGPIPTDSFSVRLPSDSRVENYVFGTAVGHMRKFNGVRNFQNFSADTYSIKNEEFWNGFKCNKIDVDDDKIGIYKTAPATVAEVSRMFPDQLALRALRDGESAKAFDGTNYFATSHVVGGVKGSVPGGEGGGNIYTVTAASADAVQHRIVLTVNKGSLGVKPIIIQEREPVGELKTDAGTPEADKKKQYEYWVDARYGVGYGFWWDTLLIKITNTPTLTELQTILGKAEVRLRSFIMQKAAGDDDDLSFHEQTNFSADTITAIHGTKLSNLMRTVLGSDTIVQSGAAVTNLYKGWAKSMPTVYLD